MKKTFLNNIYLFCIVVFFSCNSKSLSKVQNKSLPIDDVVDTTFNYVILCNLIAPKEKVIEFMKILNSEGYFYRMNPKVIGGIVVFIPFIDKPRTLNKKE